MCNRYQIEYLLEIDPFVKSQLAEYCICEPPQMIYEMVIVL